MLGILALLLVKDHQKTKDQLKSFDERIINCSYTIQEPLLGIAVCSLLMLKDYPQSLTNANILGQGNLNLVSEKSGNFTFYNLWEPCKCYQDSIFKLLTLSTNSVTNVVRTAYFQIQARSSPLKNL